MLLATTSTLTIMELPKFSPETGVGCVTNSPSRTFGRENSWPQLDYYTRLYNNHNSGSRGYYRRHSSLGDHGGLSCHVYNSRLSPTPPPESSWTGSYLWAGIPESSVPHEVPSHQNATITSSHSNMELQASHSATGTNSIKNSYVSSGASTVAIDNKIEQAMDLVKSHLMFAVREEVEVLKEQIKELLEKNNQLEYENSLLKANASADTLAQLATPSTQGLSHTGQPPSSTS